MGSGGVSRVRNGISHVAILSGTPRVHVHLQVKSRRKISSRCAETDPVSESLHCESRSALRMFVQIPPNVTHGGRFGRWLR